MTALLTSTRDGGLRFACSSSLTFFVLFAEIGLPDGAVYALPWDSDRSRYFTHRYETRC